jgi:hypothetical protein
MMNKLGCLSLPSLTSDSEAKTYYQSRLVGKGLLSANTLA